MVPFYKSCIPSHCTYAFYSQVALEAARTLDDKACWERLGDAALAQGNHLVRREGGGHVAWLDTVISMLISWGSDKATP
jgi:hypothetical protein